MPNGTSALHAPKVDAIPEIDGSLSFVANHAISVILAIGLCGVVSAFSATLLWQMNVVVEANGLIEPAHVAKVRTLASGVLQSVHVSTGDTVDVGGTIAELDRLSASREISDIDQRIGELKLDRLRRNTIRPFDIQAAQQRIELSNAQIVRAEAHVADVLLNFPGTAIRPTGAQQSREPEPMMVRVARSDLAAARAQLAIDSAALQRTQSDTLEETRSVLGERGLNVGLKHALALQQRLVISSPVRGIVLTNDLDKLTGSVVQTGDVVAEIGELRGWSAEVVVSERDIRRVQIGQQCIVYLMADQGQADREARGVVSSIATEPVRTGSAPQVQSASYRVTIRLTADSANSATHADARRGFSVRAKILLGRKRIFDVVIDRVNHRAQ